MKLVVILVVVLAVIAVAQMMRVYELSSKLRNRREEEIPRRFNELNAILWLVFMIVFYGGFIWLMARYGDGGLGPAASIHGAETDWLLGINFGIIIAVFFLTNTLLFVFAFKYYHRPGKKAYWYPHNNKLELVWTVIPAIVLAVIIILGLRTWNNITSAPSDDAVVVEIFSKQFDWTARYSGENNVLGNSDYKLINATNALGVISSATLEARVHEIEEEIVQLKAKLNSDTIVMSKAKEIELETKISRLTNVARRTHELHRRNMPIIDSLDQMANDDKIVKGEMHLKVGQEYLFVFRSQDVIHSAYFPHFRAQMNTVPGMTTTFKFTPTITTDSMRMVMNDPQFDYVLLCNKICGLSHSNMQMKVVVDNEEDYNAWLDQQKTFAQLMSPEEEGSKEEKAEEESSEEKSASPDAKEGNDDSAEGENAENGEAKEEN